MFPQQGRNGIVASGEDPPRNASCISMPSPHKEEWDLSDDFKNDFVVLMKGLADSVSGTQHCCFEMKTRGFVDSFNILEARVASWPTKSKITHSALASICCDLYEDEHAIFEAALSSSNPIPFIAKNHTLPSSLNEGDAQDTRNFQDILMDNLNTYINTRSNEIRRAYVQGFRDALKVATKWSYVTGNQDYLNRTQFVKFVKFQVNRMSIRPSSQFSTSATQNDANADVDVEEDVEIDVEVDADEDVPHLATIESIQNLSPNISFPSHNSSSSSSFTPSCTSLNSTHSSTNPSCKFSPKSTTATTTEEMQSLNSLSSSTSSLPSSSSLISLASSRNQTAHSPTPTKRRKRPLKKHQRLQKQSSFNQFCNQWQQSLELMPLVQAPFNDKTSPFWMKRGCKREACDECDEDDIALGFDMNCNLHDPIQVTTRDNLNLYHTPLKKHSSRKKKASK
eukprot:m.24627 g.24627  ORF g.24627 m.24627 type:complete len:452 (+) comp5679_c0_seq1:119-1474(+)